MQLINYIQDRHLDHGLNLKVLKGIHALQLYMVVDSNRKNLRNWFGWVDKYTNVKDSVSFVNNTYQDIINNTALAFGIFKVDQLIGVINYHDINWTKQNAYIGYWIDQNFQGRGYMTAACQKMIDLAFIEVKLKHLYLSIMTNNQKSQAVAKRLGFRFSHTISNKQKLYDRFIDHDIYQLQPSVRCTKFKIRKFNSSLSYPF